MLLTRASEYALLSLIMLSYEKDPLDVDTLSKELMISKSFLAKILQDLAKDDILKSFKGSKGGFILNKKPSDLTLKEIIKAAEKKQALVFECSASIQDCPNNKAKACKIWSMLNSLQLRIDGFLEDMSLQDVLELNN